MRARQPDEQGFVDHDGVRVAYEVYGDGEPTVVLMPTWAILTSRMWKAQVPYLARRYRVVTFDPRGNGRSDRPLDPRAYADAAYVNDTLAVMDVAGVERAVLVGLCNGAKWAVQVADAAPERVQGIVSLAAGVPHLAPQLPTPEALAPKVDRRYWIEEYRGWVEAHSGPEYMTPEPHSSKVREDLIAWGLETTGEVLVATIDRPLVAPTPTTTAEAEALVRRLRCPLLAVAGTEDRCQSVDVSARLAELSGGRLVVLEGAGHSMFARDPVVVNLLIADFVDRVAGPSTATAGDRAPRRAPANGPVAAGGAWPRHWARALERPPRVLFLCSPIGLGHARRDLAIARELRAARPGVTVEWLTQDPVTRFLEAHGERVHPASRLLANESSHIEAEAHGHELNVFEAIRRMDEILVANFMVFHDLLAEEPFDLVIGDEAWDVDRFWFENPELKRTAFTWLTDFVGWLPMPEGGEREAALTADYNAEMIAHVERYPRIRDRAIYIGDPDDIVDVPFGPGLPPIRDWVGAHFEFAGYVAGFDPDDLGPREQVRARLGYGPDEQVCLVTVGGSGVGASLLRRVVAAFPIAKRLVPALRMVVVTGPRIDPRAFAPADGLEIHGYLADLELHLAACDGAVVQGGLSTTMELTALGRPFVYVPIRRHFEQNLHVRHRLERYGAGRRLDFEDATPEALAEAIAATVGQSTGYLSVARDGAARAARSIARPI
jgi:pimeloyl-ACP methyl ester carboxylesterase/predicted glycosyltransferase